MLKNDIYAFKSNNEGKKTRAAVVAKTTAAQLSKSMFQAYFISTLTPLMMYTWPFFI